MLGRIVLIIAVLGFCDVYLVVLSAQYLGVFGAIGLCLLTAFIGGYLFKRQGLKILIEAQQDMMQGKPPVDKLADGVMILIGGVLLITPGFISDFLGFMLLIPFVRKLVRPIIFKFAKNNIKFSVHSSMSQGPSSFQQSSRNSSNEREAEIIDIK